MIRTSVRRSVCLLLICCTLPLMAQSAPSADSVVPAVVKFTGALNDSNGKPLTGTVGVTFLLYKEQTGGAPLWIETQNVQADKNGHYSVLLGSASSHGLSAEAFTGGEARWLAVQPIGQGEQARVALASVPYAMKAIDAETLGGRPASAFMAVPPAGSQGSPQGPQAEQSNEIVCSSTTACKTGFVPLFSSNGGSAKVTDSIVTQSGTTVKIAGTETTTGTISAGGDLDAGGNVNASGNVSANGNLDANGSVNAILSVVGLGGIQGGTYNSAGIGASGIGYSQSFESTNYLGHQAIGVWGDSGNYLGYGVFGSADDGIAVVGANNSSSGYPAAFFENDENGNPEDPVMKTYGGAYGGYCSIDVTGDLFCTGSKSAVVPVDGGSRKVALYAIESPENWFEDAGSSQLNNGQGVVNLESIFQQTVNTGINYQVFLTPNGDCKGLYVSQKTPTSFVVRELGGGTASLTFDYRIMAKRKGYENIRLADKTEAFSSKHVPTRAGGPHHRGEAQPDRR